MLNWNISGQTSCQSDGMSSDNNIINIDWEINEMEASEKASTNYYSKTMQDIYWCVVVVVQNYCLVILRHVSTYQRYC